MVYFGSGFTLSAWIPSCFISRLWSLDLNACWLAPSGATQVFPSKKETRHYWEQMYVPGSNLKQEHRCSSCQTPEAFNTVHTDSNALKCPHTLRPYPRIYTHPWHLTVKSTAWASCNPVLFLRLWVLWIERRVNTSCAPQPLKCSTEPRSDPRQVLFPSDIHEPLCSRKHESWTSATLHQLQGQGSSFFHPACKGSIGSCAFLHLTSGVIGASRWKMTPWLTTSLTETVWQTEGRVTKQVRRI